MLQVIYLFAQSICQINDKQFYPVFVAKFCRKKIKTFTFLYFNFYAFSFFLLLSQEHGYFLSKDFFRKPFEFFFIERGKTWLCMNEKTERKT